MSAQPKLIVLSGPSGVGKSTLVAELRSDPRLAWSVSVTTRPRRDGEVDGQDYRFTTAEAFCALRDEGGFLEHALVHDNYYGTPRGPIEEALAQGRSPLLDIDVQGARSVMECDIQAVYIFIEPPDMAELERRLSDRASDDPDVIRRRIERARAELEEREHYDHVVTNDDLERALDELRSIISGEIDD